MTIKQAIEKAKFEHSYLTSGFPDIEYLESLSRLEQILEVLKSKLEVKSLDLGIEDIFVKGTDKLVIMNEDDVFELLKEWLTN